MFNYCEKCVSKHKTKICECQYNEVNKFIKTLNIIYQKNFKLTSCPDEDENDINTVDLKFVDKLSKKNIYIEVKEVKLGYNEGSDIGEEKGQFLIRYLIAVASERLDELKNKILDKCIINIPRLQIDSKDYLRFTNEIYAFLAQNIELVKKGELNFVFKRSNDRRDEIIIKITLKNDDENRIGDKLLFAIDTKEKTIENEFYDVTKIDDIISKINYNLKNTECVENKYPKNNGKRILLNILRFPSGGDMFFNTAILEKRYLNELITSVESMESNTYESVDECYLLYDFEDFFNFANSKIKDEGNVFLCIKCFGELIEKSQLLKGDEYI